MANPKPTSSPPPPPPPPPITINNDLATAKVLTRREVLTRRFKRAKQLTNIYKTNYWIFMEELKKKHRDYYWLYGKSPFKEDEKKITDSKNNDGRGGGRGGGGGTGEKEVELERCAMAGCKTKAMALTRFCHQHILSDSKQMLYKSCSYVLKSTQTGPILCGKPVLKSTIPSLCPIHFQKSEKHLARALKKAGLNVSSPNRVAPKFHVVVAEFVRQIQTKRRVAQKAAVVKTEIKEEVTS